MTETVSVSVSVPEVVAVAVSVSETAATTAAEIPVPGSGPLQATQVQRTQRGVPDTELCRYNLPAPLRAPHNYATGQPSGVAMKSGC